MNGAPTIVAVVGAGVMGAGIAQVAAEAGHAVQLIDVQAGVAARARTKIADALAQRVQKGRITAEARDAVLARLATGETLDGLASAGLVIEAIVEDLAAKRNLWREVERLVAETAVLATNTSSLSVSAIAAALAHPARFAGLHFFNPAPLMPLVEVVAGEKTAPSTMGALTAFAESCGKLPVQAKDSPGFIVNRGARPFYAESLRFLEETQVDPATIDALVRGAGFRLGPLELIDLVGTDINLAATRSVFAATGRDPRYAPSPTIEALVAQGRLGKKSGRGFYDYQSEVRPAAAVLPTSSPPAEVVVHGTPEGTDALMSAWTRLGVRIREESGPEAWFAVGGIRFRLSDGRTARFLADTHGGPWVVVDWALDPASPRHLAVAGTDDAAVAQVAGLWQLMGAKVSRVPDVPGLLVARLLATLVNEAADLVARGVASVHDVDFALQKGMNFPGGPLGWSDRFGADRIVRFLDRLAAVDPRYQPNPLLRRAADGGGRFHA